MEVDNNFNCTDIIKDNNEEENTNCTNLTDNSTTSCTLSTHHYHYIQYPYATTETATATATAINSTTSTTTNNNILDLNCHCHCHNCTPITTTTTTTLAATEFGIGGGVTTSNINNHDSGQLAVAVIVHRQASGHKAQSEQSLLNHSYEALQLQTTALNKIKQQQQQQQTQSSTLNINCDCDCDLECTCNNGRDVPDLNTTTPTTTTTTKLPLKSHTTNINDVMLGLDEITVSESDNNSTMLKQKKRDCTTHASSACSNKQLNAWCDKHGEPHIDDIYSDGGEICDNLDGVGIKKKQRWHNSDSTCNGIDVLGIQENCSSEDSGNDAQRPPLPPRPAMRSHVSAASDVSGK